MHCINILPLLPTNQPTNSSREQYLHSCHLSRTRSSIYYWMRHGQSFNQPTETGTHLQICAYCIPHRWHNGYTTCERSCRGQHQRRRDMHTRFTRARAWPEGSTWDNFETFQWVYTWKDNRLEPCRLNITLFWKSNCKGQLVCWFDIVQNVFSLFFILSIHTIKLLI